MTEGGTMYGDPSAARTLAMCAFVNIGDGSAEAYTDSSVDVSEKCE